MNRSYKKDSGKFLNRKRSIGNKDLGCSCSKEGDETTKFFHVVANGHKNQNFIPSINLNGDIFTYPKDISKVFTTRFKQQVGLNRGFRFRVDFQKLLVNKLPVDLSQLDRPFTLEEIKGVVFELGRDKAPKPDGCPLYFFKHFWDLIKRELEKLCEDFY